MYMFTECRMQKMNSVWLRAISMSYLRYIIRHLLYTVHPTSFLYIYYQCASFLAYIAHLQQTPFSEDFFCLLLYTIYQSNFKRIILYVFNMVLLTDCECVYGVKCAESEIVEMFSWCETFPRKIRRKRSFHFVGENRVHSAKRKTKIDKRYWMSWK